MATKRASGAVQKNAAGQQRESLFASRSRLLARIGPPVFEAAAPKAGAVFLMRRYDLMALVRRGHWPKPITSQVSKLVMEGVKTPSAGDETDRFTDMCHALVVASAIVPPAQIEALGGPPESEPELPILPGMPADTLEARLVENAKRAEARERTVGEWRRAVREALAGVDLDDCEPLFVERGEEPSENQLVLVRHGDPVPADPSKGEVQLHLNDLVSLATAISSFQTGALATFHERP